MTDGKERKVAEETTVTETVTEETTEKSLDLALFVERRAAKDKFGKAIKTKTGEQVYNYVLPVELRGRKTVVDFITIDKGGFEPLDLVYNGADRAELAIIPYEREINGKKTSGINYEIRSIDEDGVLWKCGVRPARRSDTDLMDMYINVLIKKAG